MDLCFEGEEGTKRCEDEVEVVEFERVRTPVDVVLIAYGCGFDLTGVDVLLNERDGEEVAAITRKSERSSCPV